MGVSVRVGLTVPLSKFLERLLHTYLTKKEMGDYWYKNPLLIEFTDGTAILSQSDDEGNDGGAYYYFGKKKQEVIPTL